MNREALREGRIRKKVGNKEKEDEEDIKAREGTRHKGKWGDRRQKGLYGLRKKNWWRHKDTKADEKISGNWNFMQVLEIRGKRKLSYQNKKRKIKIWMLKWGWHFYNVII